MRVELRLLNEWPAREARTVDGGQVAGNVYTWIFNRFAQLHARLVENLASPSC